VPADRGVRFAGIGDEAAPDLSGQLAALAELGWSSIELRTVDGIALADLDDRAFGRLAAALARRGLSVPCIASRIGNWSRPIDSDFGRDLAELDVLARRCAALGAPFIRVMSYPNAGLAEPRWRRLVLDRMRALAGRAHQSGLVLVHENCAGWAASCAGRMLDLVDAVDSPALRLLFDTGNGLAYGYDPYELLVPITPYVAHVHVKDAAAGPVNTASAYKASAYKGPVYTVPGGGTARVAECLRLLVSAGYAGTWSIEPHLALRPHEATPGTGDRDGFVASGLALARLVREEVLPCFPGLVQGPAGIAWGARA
jgi:sugar phosphate isomerase/epimerase